MSGATQVIINTQTAQAKISVSGVDVFLVSGSLTETIVGIPGAVGSPGANGTDGAPGPKGDQGDPGAGMPAGGTAGRVPVKQSGADFDVDWSTNFKIDPATGWVGAGTDDPKGPVHAKGNAQAIVLENALDPGDRWVISPGHPGVYDGYLIFAHGDNITAGSHVLRLVPGSPLTFVLGATAADGTGFGSESSFGLAYYSPFDGTRGSLRFRGASATGEFQLEGSYYDSGWNVVNVAKLTCSAAGPRMAVGDIIPTTTLHVDGPVRTAPYTATGVPSASSVGAGTMIYVTDAAAGARPFWSDGSQWRDGAGTALS